MRTRSASGRPSKIRLSSCPGSSPRLSQDSRCGGVAEAFNSIGTGRCRRGGFSLGGEGEGSKGLFGLDGFEMQSMQGKKGFGLIGVKAKRNTSPAITHTSGAQLDAVKR